MSVLAAVAVPHPPMILPEIGRGSEASIQETIDSYRHAARFIAEQRPDTVVVTTPHSIMYSDYLHISPVRGDGTAWGSFAGFGAPQVTVKVQYDAEFIDALCKACDEKGVRAGTLGERDPALDHATMIPLIFLREAWSELYGAGSDGAGGASGGNGAASGTNPGASGTGINEGTFGDLYVLPFPQIVRIGLSGLSPLMHYELGRRISETADKLGRRVAIMASGDLSHKVKEDGPYGLTPEGPEFDAEITSLLDEADFLYMLLLDPAFCNRAAECGLRSFWIMAGTLDRKAITHRLLSYQGVTGVGYGVAEYLVTADDELRNIGDQYISEKMRRMDQEREKSDVYVRLARLSYETFVKTGKTLKYPDDLPADLRAELSEELTDGRAGAFVSLKIDGRLRGCIGTILPTRETLAEEIINNAVSACSHDPRFDAVTVAELPEISCSVDVLGASEPVSGPEELDPTRYGVIVISRDGRHGLLLPNLDGVETVEEQIAISRKKANIGRNEPVSLERFEVVRHY